MNARGLRLKPTVLQVLAATALLTGLAGCGGVTSGEPAAGNPPAAPSSSTPSVGTGDTVLTIVVDDGKGIITTQRLTCNPVGGDHPDPAAACRVLLEHGAEALPAVPSDRYCTQNMAGPQS